VVGLLRQSVTCESSLPKSAAAGLLFCWLMVNVTLCLSDLVAILIGGLNHMSFIDDLIKVVLKDLKDYAKANFKKKAPELVEYMNTFLLNNTVDIERWEQLVKEGKLTGEEFSWMLKSRRDSLELKFLELGGYYLVNIEQTRDDLIKLIIKSALSLIK
jgi:hypothetical protein